MCKRKYLIAGLLGIFTALLFGGTASGTVTGQTYTATVSPKKEDKKTFGGVSLTNVIDTQYQDLPFPAATNPDQITLTFSKDIRFTPAHTPECNPNDIENMSTAGAKASCPNSMIGQGSAQVLAYVSPPPYLACPRVGALYTCNGVVTAFNGVSSPISPSPNVLLHFDVDSVGGFVFDLVGSLNTQANTLTVRLPICCFWFPHLDLTINKLKTGKKTYYVSARCKKKHWTNSATSHFPDGSTTTAYSTQRCRRKS